MSAGPSRPPVPVLTITPAGADKRGYIPKADVIHLELIHRDDLSVDLPNPCFDSPYPPNSLPLGRCWTIPTDPVGWEIFNALNPCHPTSYCHEAESSATSPTDPSSLPARAMELWNDLMLSFCRSDYAEKHPGLDPNVSAEIVKTKLIWRHGFWHHTCAVTPAHILMARDFDTLERIILEYKTKQNRSGPVRLDRDSPLFREFQRHLGLWQGWDVHNAERPELILGNLGDRDISEERIRDLIEGNGRGKKP
ncbi:hypothetical protein GGR57DRAFT_498005 [Xylariaceae sp. FL1272]|nr:hypothetical protein GGR57DRAFT_498005 [Xylariaceae sp. FL1272]